MAAGSPLEPELTEDEFTVCPACGDVVIGDLVQLSCRHGLCCTCLRRYWEQKEALDCPFCWSAHSSEPPPNLALRKRPRQETRTHESFCNLHYRRLEYYCLRDERLACELCLASWQHLGHTFCSVPQAARKRKAVLSTARQTLQKKLKPYKTFRGNLEDSALHIESQVLHTERQIKDEFEGLHRFLRDEEEARLAALWGEGKKKSQAVREMIKKVSVEMSSILDTIRIIELQIGIEDLVFLQSYKSTMQRTYHSLCDLDTTSGVFYSFVRHIVSLVRRAFSSPGEMHMDTIKRACSTPQDPGWPPGSLINVAQHLGSLNYRVWEKMLGTVQCTPVTLDPNTAAPCLVLSEDLTSVRYSSEWKNLPDNPERFAIGAETLGSQGFGSGTHSWDIEVGNNTNWAVGVARKSVAKKEKTMLRPEDGILALRFLSGRYTVESVSVPVARRPQRIRVQLNWRKGLVTFSDPVNKCHIRECKFTFHETVFPYFYTLCKEHPLQIVPENVYINVGTLKREKFPFWVCILFLFSFFTIVLAPKLLAMSRNVM